MGHRSNEATIGDGSLAFDALTDEPKELFRRAVGCFEYFLVGRVAVAALLDEHRCVAKEGAPRRKGRPAAD